MRPAREPFFSELVRDWALSAGSAAWNRAGHDPVPFHPSASHVEPGYRDGWNAALYKAHAALALIAARDAEIERLRAQLAARRIGMPEGSELRFKQSRFDGAATPPAAPAGEEGAGS